MNAKRYIIENLLLLAIAVVLILISPRALGNAIIRLIGIVVLVGGLGLILFDVFAGKNVIEGEVVQVKEEAPENHDGDAQQNSSENDGDL